MSQVNKVRSQAGRFNPNNPPKRDRSATFNDKPNKPSATNGRQFDLATAAIIGGLIMVLFAADYVFLGKSGDSQTSWLGNLAQLWGLISGSFASDCILSVSVITLVAYQLGYFRSFPFPPADKSTHSSRKALWKAKQGDASPKATQKRPTSYPQRTVAERTQTTPPWPRQTPPSVTTDKPVALVNQAIDYAARQGDSKKAGRLLIEFEQCSDGQPGNYPDSVSYNLVIRACAKKGDYKGAEYWIDRMEKNVEPSVCSYNTVLDACAKADNAEACEAWLHRMVEKGIEANVISYATLIYAWARRGDEISAQAWLQKMQAAGVKPDAVSYNSLIHACSTNGNFAGAERWLEEMTSRGLEATVTSFTSVMDAAAKSGDIQRAEMWLEKMMEAKVEPNVVSFCAILDACAKAYDPARAEYWHDRMLQRGIKPNAHSVSTVINACSKAGDVDRAEAWLERAIEEGVATDVVVFSSVIDACSKASDAERAMKVFKKIKENGLRPHIVAYAALARPFAYRGDWETVEDIAKDLVADGLTPNEYFIYAQLLSYSIIRPKQSNRAEVCFRSSMRLGVKANDHVVGALCRAVGRDHCVKLMAELCNGRPVPLPPGLRQQAQGKDQPTTGSSRSRRREARSSGDF